MEAQAVLSIEDLDGAPPADSLFHCNVVDFLSQTPDGFADLVFTSPPYWTLVDYGEEADIDGGQLGLESSPEEYIARIGAVFLGCLKKLKPSGHLVINIKDTYMAKRAKQAVQTRHQAKVIGRAGRIPGHDIIPNKSLCLVPERLAWKLIEEGGARLRSKDIWHDHARLPEPNVKDRHWQKYEHILHFARSGKSYSKFKEEGGHPGGNVLDLLHTTHDGVHHATMPYRLAVEYIDMMCPKGGVVFDPFCGTGTTAVVAKALGRSFVGTEIVRKFIEDAAVRVINEDLRVQLSLEYQE